MLLTNDSYCKIKIELDGDYFLIGTVTDYDYKVNKLFKAALQAYTEQDLTFELFDALKEICKKRLKEFDVNE